MAVTDGIDDAVPTEKKKDATATGETPPSLADADNNNAAATLAPKPEGGGVIQQQTQPDGGGMKAWLQVLGCWFLVFNAFGVIIVFGDFQAFYERGTLFQESSSNISWIGSIQSLMMFAAGTVSGPLFDRGHVKLLVVAGAVLIALGHMMLSLCTRYWQALLAQGFMVGLGSGCLFVPAVTLPQQWFGRQHLGLVLGLVGTGSSIGNVIYAVVFINLIDSSAGFAWTTRALGFLALGTLALPLALLEVRVKNNTAASSPRPGPDLSAFRDARFLLCALACALGYAGCQVAFFYTAFYGQAQGFFVGNVALYLTPIINAGALIGRVIPNWIADKIGPINVVIPGCILIGVVLLCNLAVVNAGGAICTALFIGMLSGIFVSLPPLLFIILTRDKSKVGARMGMGYLLVGLSVLPGGPGAGGVLQHDPSRLDWTAAWAYAGALPLAAFVVFSALRFTVAGPRLMVKV